LHFKYKLESLTIVLLLLFFTIPFALAQTSNFYTGYGWSIGTSTPIPTPIPTPTSSPYILPTSSPQTTSNSTEQTTLQPSPSGNSTFTVVLPSTSPEIPEENPLLVIAVLFVLGLLLALVFKVNKQKRMKLRTSSIPSFIFKKENLLCNFNLNTLVGLIK
jgi:hypothetical protein